ncbi:putative UPF0160 domain protein MYG1 [Delitschia confertaspora ATCC 74209]|uniref:UPF0160 domain protein MYG1 n=1 Tax=Delitschia confertaspora ATCC 74209 TaxID=1513339 RepID=A0A9P4JS34_9PLEO|nr:putative UPF0160 domain protein MYG1 [Delitschia confertaspora ATCC 74209]
MSLESPTKKQKMDGPTIGTHNGHFHADEALAVSMLRLLPTYSSSPLIRTRDPALLESCHTVVDVGGKYDPANNLFDHHQREFVITFPGHNTRLSSAGLVYMNFGKAIIKQVTGLSDGEDVDVLYEKLYTEFIEAFDANDNGVSVYPSKALAESGLTKSFEDRGFSIASVVNRFNYPYPRTSSEGKSKEQLQSEEDARFANASSFVGQQFLLELNDKAVSWLPARKTVAEAYSHRLKWDPKGRIMVLSEGMPWADHLYSFEKANPIPEGVEPHVLYVLFPETKDVDSKWRIRSVSKENGGFENRKDMPNAWKGLRDEELSRVAGIPGCVFVHASGFIGGNLTFEGCLEMAKKSCEA